MKKNFTLIELLVVIAVIAILAGMLLPSLATARKTAHRIQCTGNIKQFSVAGIAYMMDNSEWMPYIIGIFLDPHDSKGYRHFMINPAGGHYDAFGQNAAWNPRWERVVKLEKDRWIAEIAIPYQSLDVSAPKEGDQWSIVVDYTKHKPETENGPIQFGYPYPAYHDVSGGAILNFSDKDTRKNNI